MEETQKIRFVNEANTSDDDDVPLSVSDKVTRESANRKNLITIESGADHKIFLQKRLLFVETV